MAAAGWAWLPLSTMKGPPGPMTQCAGLYSGPQIPGKGVEG